MVVGETTPFSLIDPRFWRTNDASLCKRLDFNSPSNYIEVLEGNQSATVSDYARVSERSQHSWA